MILLIWTLESNPIKLQTKENSIEIDRTEKLGWVTKWLNQSQILERKQVESSEKSIAGKGGFAASGVGRTRPHHPGLQRLQRRYHNAAPGDDQQPPRNAAAASHEPASQDH